MITAEQEIQIIRNSVEQGINTPFGNSDNLIPAFTDDDLDALLQELNVETTDCNDQSSMIFGFDLPSDNNHNGNIIHTKTTIETTKVRTITKTITKYKYQPVPAHSQNSANAQPRIQHIENNHSAVADSKDDINEFKRVSECVVLKQSKPKSKSNSDCNTKETKVIPKGCEMLYDCDGKLRPELAHLDTKLVETVSYELMDHNPQITWSDIAGLQSQKQQIREIVVWPLLRPDIFCGLREPPKGLLLFGPPGTGKTLIAKAIASDTKTKFFSVSASSMTSKWHGESEKLVRTLFCVARFLAPAIVFIDEIDSLLSQRSASEHDATRRLKTEFLVQLDGCQSKSLHQIESGQKQRSSHLLIIGATNRPQEIDEAARRRLVRRLYIPLPDDKGRAQMLTRLLNNERHNLTATQLQQLVIKTKGYSGADISALATEAAFGPIRRVNDIRNLNANDVSCITLNDFEHALKTVRASVSNRDLRTYEQWNAAFGSLS